MAGREHMVNTNYPSTSLNWLTEYQQVRNEIAVLKRVSVGHRNILTLVDYFETMNNCMELQQSAVRYMI
jgi:hypothetical protein